MSKGEFIVSALKYRPSDWDQVVGQSAITTTLKNAISNEEIAKAYLFCGPRGVGKTTSARIFAKAINEKYLGPDQDLSFNIFELDAASNNSVEDIRSLIDQVRIQPPVGKYKVYIIDEVHMLSTAAFNAFLKTLEEPPPHAIFVLATTEKHKVLPTILSRCQIYDFSRISVQDMAAHLSRIAQDQDITFEEEALHLISQKADGALRDALSIFDQMVSFSGKHLTYKAVAENLNVLDHDYFFRLTDAIQRGNLKDALIVYDEIVANGFDSLLFIVGLAAHLRDILVSSDPSTVALLDLTEAIKKRYVAAAGLFDSGRIIEFLGTLQKAEVQYKTSRNQRLLTEITLMEMCRLQGISDAPATEKKTELSAKSTEKKNAPAPVTSPPPATKTESYTASPNACSEPIEEYSANSTRVETHTEEHVNDIQTPQSPSPQENELPLTASAEVAINESISAQESPEVASSEEPVAKASIQEQSIVQAVSPEELSPSSETRAEMPLSDGPAMPVEEKKVAVDTSPIIEKAEPTNPYDQCPPLLDKESEPVIQNAKDVPLTLSASSRKIHGSISIIDLEDDEEEEEEMSSAAEPEIHGRIVEERPLMKSWRAYADVIKEQKKFSFHSTLNNRTPQIVDGNTIHITLENEVQMEDLQVEKADLMSYLRKDLDHPTLRLTADIRTDESESIAFQTPKEQLKHMVQKNPNLGEMTKRFDLDVNY